MLWVTLPLVNGEETTWRRIIKPYSSIEIDLLTEDTNKECSLLNDQLNSVFKR